MPNQPPILRLPTELLLKVVSCIPAHADSLVLYGYQDDLLNVITPGERKRLIARNEVRTLYDLALTHRKFTRIAQEILLQAPVIDCAKKGTNRLQLVALLELLFEYPDLRVKVRKLRLQLSQALDYSDAGNLKLYFRRSGLENRCIANAEQLNLSRFSLRSWITDIREGYQPAFAGVLISLLPNLEQLVLLPGKSLRPGMPWALQLMDLFGGSLEVNRELLRVPGLKSLNYYKTQGGMSHQMPSSSSKFVPSMRALHTIRTLDLNVPTFLYGGLEGVEFLTEFRLGHKCSILQGPHVGGREDGIMPDLKLSLERMTNLKSFVLYDNSTTISLDLDNQPRCLCNCHRPFRFDNLFGPLVTLLPSLESVILPEDWYSSTAAQTRPIMYRPNFTALRRLTVPKCALISQNWPLPDLKHVLSCSLHFLRISQIDQSVCACLVQLINDMSGSDVLPNLKEIELVIGSTRGHIKQVKRIMRSKPMRNLISLAKENGIRLMVECPYWAEVFST